MTSGGVPLTRERLVRILAGLPVTPQYCARDGMLAHGVRHELDGRRGFHPVNRWSDEQFAQARDPDMEAAAVALAAAGYHVTLRPHPDPELVADLPPQLRVQLAGSRPVMQPYVIADDPY